MPLVSIPAHFDGKQVQLDENVSLPVNARLIVTVLGDANEERRDFLMLSENALDSAYDDDEVEYSESDIKT